jgi:chemotaxis signal transduction protein
MTGLAKAGDNSFVLLQIGNRRVALPAGSVAELAPPVRLHTFPHTAPRITGVIVRRGRIVPVYDVGAVLEVKSSSVQRFYLIARRQLGQASEWGAIPVNGECELVTSQLQPGSTERPAYVAGTLAIGNESVDVLDLEALITAECAGENPSLCSKAPS